MLIELFLRIGMHLIALHPLITEVEVSTVFINPWFWLEILVCVPCCSPFIMFELVATNYFLRL